MEAVEVNTVVNLLLKYGCIDICDKVGGKELLGLTRRRKAEADLYFSK